MTRDESDYFEAENGALLAQLPHDQCERIFESEFGDIGPEFLGFIGVYSALAKIIPRHWAVVDLGCASAPQSFLFQDHARYIGVDLPPSHYGRDKTERFKAENATFHEMTIAEFCAECLADLDLKTTFAICSYVPPWHGDNCAIARQHFENVFTFYPDGESVVPDFLKK